MPELNILQTDTRERRFISGVELRIAAEEGRTIEGYAVLWDDQTEIWRGYFEKFQRGAFKRALDNGADVRALFNHDPNLILARSKAATLEVKEDEKGLWYRFDVPDTSYGNDLLTSVTRRDVSGSSFAFSAVKEEFEDLGEDRVLRTVIEAKLYDVSPTTYPAYESPEIMVRSAFRNFKNEKQNHTEGDGEAGDANPAPESHFALLKRRQRLLELQIRNGGKI